MAKQIRIQLKFKFKSIQGVIAGGSPSPQLVVFNFFTWNQTKSIDFKFLIWKIQRIDWKRWTFINFIQIKVGSSNPHQGESFGLVFFNFFIWNEKTNVNYKLFISTFDLTNTKNWLKKINFYDFHWNLQIKFKSFKS